MVERIVVCFIGQDCENVIKMSMKSVEDADAIVFVDGGSGDNTKEIVKKYANEFLYNKYDKIDKMMNGRQRNIYLEHVKNKYPNYWCLVLDPDEIVGDFSKIREFVQTAPKNFLYSIKMRHLIGDLGHEDTSLPSHFVPHRLFHVDVDANLFYPKIEHPVLQRPGCNTINQDMTTIWHLAYIPNMWEFKKRYENHTRKSQMHSEKFLKSWYYAHLFGQFPSSLINLIDLPKILLEEFGIDKDELYFTSRMSLETKHFVMIKQWSSLVEDAVTNGINIVDFGCGAGHYGKAATFFFENMGYSGFEISDWVIKNTPHKDLSINKMDITKQPFGEGSDLALCVDVLEHLNPDDLDTALDNIKQSADYFIFSIPFIGNPNLEADTTHIIKETKEWWVKKLKEHFKIKDAPTEWLFANQILIGEKK